MAKKDKKELKKLYKKRSTNGRRKTKQNKVKGWLFGLNILTKKIIEDEGENFFLRWKSFCLRWKNFLEVKKNLFGWKTFFGGKKVFLKKNIFWGEKLFWR